MRDAISERGGGGDRAVAETAHSRCFFFPSSGTPARVGPVPGEGSSGEAEAMMMCSAGAQAASLLPHPKEMEEKKRTERNIMCVFAEFVVSSEIMVSRGIMRVPPDEQEREAL